MFKHEGPTRDLRTNTLVATYLAATAGYVNAGGFVLIGSYTSHVTGSVGRFANDLANGNFGASFAALTLVLAFLGGAVAASLIVEGRGRSRASRYAIALGVEAGLLACFIFIAGLSRATHPRILDAKATLLCAAMGMQNSLVTRLSGAIVRTTHLTGVLTDLGIELARWYNWSQARLIGWTGDTKPPPRPDGHIALLLAITVAFVFGGALGGVLTARASRWAMTLPAAMIGAAALFAFYQALPARAASTK
ncbi:MAG TPA: YoaK family protein [Polyangiaceae bacterium]